MIGKYFYLAKIQPATEKDPLTNCVTKNRKEKIIAETLIGETIKNCLKLVSQDGYEK